MKSALEHLTCVVLIRGEDNESFDFELRDERARIARGLRLRGRAMSNLRSNAANIVEPTRYQREYLGTSTLLPNTAQAFRDHEIGVDAVGIIRSLLSHVLDDEVKEMLEAELADMARNCSLDQLKRAGTALIQAYGFGNNKKDRDDRRNVYITQQGPDLMSRIGGELTPELDALLRRLFIDYAGPGDLLEEGADDQRTPGQRQHDALVHALKFALNEKGPLKPTRGCASVVVSMTLDQLCAGTGVAMTDVGTLITIDELISLGAAQFSYLALLDNSGDLLHLCRTSRSADVSMYIGMVASQGGDQTPGSNLPAAMCEIHHIKAWSQGGETTPDNLMFLNRKTHANVDDLQLRKDKYWTMRLGDKVVIQEPCSIDPDRPFVANIAPWSWWCPGVQARYAEKGGPHQSPWHLVSGVA
ncbi:DUF222 domain-containing protein [Corynebacterium breve]|uniref:DUF222 domain-containing protein n=1 Tax=Corynebacterium breve TaxID=3049799 RepID=A0ABY8VHC3_9CORY|nr:HNH endonuclease signature motif containing protein [Corynebacterium breve]WIM69091.1 DUF222 domain-containing protein [Corynebacterium breve]